MPDAYTPDVTVILAFTLVLFFCCYQLGRIYRKFKNRKQEEQRKTDRKQQKNAEQKKDDALEKFKKIHAAARDHRQKIARAIAEDPEKTTETLRKMMKK